jgi:hypothetical protein
MKDRIIEMLGKGITAVQVASAVGCDESYVSQLLAEEGVLEKITQAKAEHFSKYVEQDQCIDDAEAEALKKVAYLVPFITKPAEAVRVFAVLNAAKRRTSDNLNAANAIAATVSLDLPAAARVRFTLTADKQVIEIEGRSMATLPAKSLAARLEQRNAARMLTSEIPDTLFTVLPSKAEVPLANQL